VLGAIILVVALLVFPVLVAMSGVIAAALFGETLTPDAEHRHEGSEHVDLS
jgi:flagellar basal body-associated protein FliL